MVFEVVYLLAQMASAEAATRAAIQDLCEGRKLNAVAVVLDLVDTRNVTANVSGAGRLSDARIVKLGAPSVDQSRGT